MKILIDTRWIRSLKIDGVANFTLNVTKELLEIKNNEYILLSNSAEIESFISEYCKKDLKSLFYKVDSEVTSPKNIFQFRKIIKETKPDIFFSPCHTIYSPFINCRQIGVIHDLIPLIFPKMFKNSSLKFRLAYSNKFILNKSLGYLNNVITVSNSTKNDLTNYLKISEDKIRVIVEGVNFQEIDKTNSENVLKKYDITKPYFLFVGRHEVYKNIKANIEVYAKLSKSVKEEFNLVIIGKFNESITPELFKLVERLDIKDKVLFIESVMPDMLPYFYKNAKLLIHLSLYEGFGLTVLEAMKYGLPVIVSNRASMPEVAEDAAMIVNPDDYNEIVTSITRLINNNALYQEIISKGLLRSKNFSWQKAAEQLNNIMKSIL